MRILASLIVITFLVIPAIGQSRLEDVLEHLLDERDDLDAELLYDLAERRVDLHAAPMDELAVIPLLSRIVIDSIVVIRQTDERPESVEGWILRLDLDGMEAEVLRTFATVAPVRHLPAKARRFRPDVRMTSRFSRRLDIGRGYRLDDNGRAAYAGTPERLYQRIYLRSGSIQANLTMDKAPGEPIDWQPERRWFGLTHSTGYLSYAPADGVIERLIAGDYRADFGYGLVTGSNLFSSKGRETTRAVRHGGRGIQPSSSSMRQSYFRGGSASLRISSLRLYAFASRATIDATIDTVMIDGAERIIAGRSSSGYYRTETERGRMRSLPETSVGAAAEWSHRALSVGAAMLRTSWAATMTRADRPDLIPLHDRSAFTARSVFVHVRLPMLSAGGEIAVSGASRPALLAAASLQPDDKIEVLAAYRHYPADFDNHHATAFGHQSAPRNETGVYLGMKAALSQQLTIRAYFDQYRFPWLQFGLRTPSTGADRLVEVEVSPRSWWTLQVLGRSRSEEYRTVVMDTGNLSGTGIAKRQSIRLHQDFRVDHAWRVRIRVEASRYTNESGQSDSGIMLYNDIAWRPHSSLSVMGRVTYFDVSHFDARIFSHEASPGTFALQQLNGIGDRWYGMVSWQITSSSRLQLKYGRHRLEDVKTMGSGNDEVEGSRLREIAAQLNIRL